MRLNKLITITLLLLPLSVAAESAQEKGLTIAREMDRLDTGWKDSSADMNMVLRNRQGQETTRNIRIRNMEVNGDGDKSLSIFDNPRDVKGTAFLSYTHIGEADDQWLYLPALKRVKRISSRNKSGPFMGSEFAYEDITSDEVEKYSYKWLKDEKLDGKDCFVVERVPTDKNSGYSKQIAWINKTIYRPQKIEYYDRKGSLLKTLTFNNYQQYLEKYWRADEMFMNNHVTKKSTRLTWKNYKFANGYTDRDFDRNSLKNAR